MIIYRDVFLFSVFCILLSLPKLYFVIHDALPVFQRTFEGNPSEGSIHIWWTLLPFIVPFKIAFYDRPFFQQTIGFYFNWYEYYAFLSPLPFLFFIPILIGTIRAQKISDEVKYVLLFLITGLLYISLAYPYSPFYWLFEFVPQLHIFRVPQRMYLPLSSIMIALFCMAAQQWNPFDKLRVNNRTMKQWLFHGILWLTLLTTGISSLHALRFAMEPERTREKTLVQWLKNYDQGNYFVYDALCCNQRFLVEEKIPILNFYAGWIPKGTPMFPHVYPTYILSTNSEDYSIYSYKKIHQIDIGSIWKTENPTVFPENK